MDLPHKILGAIAEAELEFARVPKPAKHAPWWVQEEHAAQVEHGPRWRIAGMFGTGLPDVVRVRILRTLRKLEARGLVVADRSSGRLRHAKLTGAGRKRLDELDAAEDADLEDLDAELTKSGEMPTEGTDDAD